MAKRTPPRSVLSAASLVLCIQTLATAEIPSDQLMSSATRGFISIADYEQLSENWHRTQFGQLMQDEAMQPFVRDMQSQLHQKLAGVRDKLGLQVADLKGVASGEIGVGLIERENTKAAVALTADVTGRLHEAEGLLRKVDRELASRNATKSIVTSGDATLAVYDIPPQYDGDVAREAVFFVHRDILCGCDNRGEAEEMLRRFGAGAGNSLANAPAYRETMQRCATEAGDLAPEARWFVDPFGYARASRSLLNKPKPPGKDYVEILRSQGFDAIQGLGGFVNLAVYGSFELMHRTSIYAPPIPGAEQRYRLAMRMLQFPNGGELAPQAWVPRGLASYRTFNMDLQNAFSHFSSLFDAFVGQENAFADVLEGLERDPYGPQVKVQNDFVRHLGQRVTLVTDYEVPITTKSERFLLIVEVKDEAAIEEAVRKFMEADPNAHRLEFEGKIIWEIAEEQHDVPELEITFEFDPLDEAADADDSFLNVGGVQSSAVCVLDGELLIASHLSYLQKVVSSRQRTDALSDAGDFREVNLALQQLIAGPVCARCFLRTDEAYRPTYELLRQGKMPESETLFGRVLNRMLTPPEDESEGILRKQKIDGRQLPSFEMVRRYFSPAGTLIRSDSDGWFVVGATLSKQTAPQARATGSASPEPIKVR